MRRMRKFGTTNRAIFGSKFCFFLKKEKVFHYTIFLITFIMKDTLREKSKGNTYGLDSNRIFLIQKESFWFKRSLFESRGY